MEEQRRHIDMMELENGRVSEQVNLEIQRVKNQFQEKLQELTPLPDVLRCTQTKLQEAQQMHMLAERNNEAMARELQLYKDKIAEMARELNELRGDDDEAAMSLKIEQLNKTIEDLNADLAVCRQELTKTTSLADEKDRLAQAKLHEIAQLQAQLEGVREESARQVARTKDRCETVRRSMQNQISGKIMNSSTLMYPIVVTLGYYLQLIDVDYRFGTSVGAEQGSCAYCSEGPRRDSSENAGADQQSE